ncbi:hypothetical protein GCM10027184_16840 [Saccharothrix stipae]
MDPLQRQRPAMTPREWPDCALMPMSGCSGLRCQPENCSNTCAGATPAPATPTSSPPNAANEHASAANDARTGPTRMDEAGVQRSTTEPARVSGRGRVSKLGLRKCTTTGYGIYDTSVS